MNQDGGELWAPKSLFPPKANLLIALTFFRFRAFPPKGGSAFGTTRVA
jgi:hypothetical protein